MKYRRHRRAFMTVLIAAIVIDSGFDCLALRESYTTEKTGEAVVQSYQVLGEIAEMQKSLRDNLQARMNHDENGVKESISRLKDHFHQLSTLADANSLIEVRLRPFQLLDSPVPLTSERLSSHFARLTSALSDVRENEQSLLTARLHNDSVANRKARNQIIGASIFDFILMLAAGALWFWSDRVRKKTETLLEAAIATAEQSQRDLQRVLDKKASDLQTAVHDLKNPLGSIKGYSDLIQEDSHNPASVTEMSLALQRLSVHTLELVNSLLEVESKSASPDAQVRSINISHYVEDVCSALKPQLLKKRQKLVTANSVPDIQIHGDPKKLWDVFMNIIGNAVKFSPLGSTINVRCELAGPNIVISVDDEGPGFSESDKLLAFVGGAKLTAKPTGGEISTGLGLNIAKSVIVSHGGSILILDSDRGRGSKIVISLPAMGVHPQLAEQDHRYDQRHEQSLGQQNTWL